MHSNRRQFLGAAAAGSVGLAFGRPFLLRAAGEPDRTIALKPAVLAIFLRGGQDALNTLVPYSDGRYYDIRPNIAVPPPNQTNGAIDLDGTFGLNPGLGGFKKLWDKGMLAPIVNAGLGHPSRSHFACQDYMEFGALGDASVHDGWLNRYLTATAPGGRPDGEFRAVALQARLPKSMRGSYPVLAIDPRGVLQRQGENVLDLFDDLYKRPPSMQMAGMTGDRPDADALTDNGRATIDTLRKLEEILTTKPYGVEVPYPASLGLLGQQLRMAARIIKSGQGVEAIGLDWNGWDHHIREGGAGEQDTIRRMLTVLGDALATFYEDIHPMRRFVTTVVMTEFGRTNRENGNFGTDHGHGGNMYVIGGNVVGGKVYGDWTGLVEGRTYQDRDLQVTTDWRRVLDEILHDHLRLSKSKNLFKNWTPAEKPMGLFTA